MGEFLPAMKFPTTWVIVDDNAQFLNKLKLVLGGEFKYKGFHSAKEALHFVQQQETALNRIIKQYFSISIESGMAPKPVINFDVAALHHVLFDLNRFSLSAVMVTDYAMPDMNGLELCERLGNRLIKIIMLTGEVGYDLAVSGFNKGVIDQFVLKSDADFFEKIKDLAIGLETRLFAQISKSLIDAITGKPDTVFNDPVFIQFFKDLINKHHITEYYMLDESGSYLLVDAEGQVFWLIVKDEVGMRVLYELAEGDNGVSPAILAALKNKQKLAFFPTKAHEIASAKEWRLEDTHRLEAKHGIYYYSLIHGCDQHYALGGKKVLTYSDYLKEECFSN